MTRGLAYPLAAIARRDARLLLSYRSTFVARPAGVLFSLALFYFVSRLVTVSRFETPDGYFAFVAAGIVAFGMVGSSLVAPARVREELVGGTYERLELSPAGGTLAVAGMLIVPFVYTAALAVFGLGLAATVFDMDVRWDTAPLALPLGLLGGLAFAPFGLLFSAVTLAFKQAPGLGAVLPALSLVSGLYFPVDLLPGWMRWLSEVQPLTPTADLMRHVLIGFAVPDGLGFELLRLVLFAAVGVPAGLYAVSLAHRFGRRRGTLLES